MPEHADECGDLDNLDIHDPAFARDPYPTYARWRDRCPVPYTDKYGGFWTLTRYEDVRQAAMDWRTFTSSVVGVTAIPIITHRTEPQLPIELDPPLHSRYRALVNPVFSVERIAHLRPRIVAIAAGLIDHMLDDLQGRCDLVSEYAVPLSVNTLAAFTNLPATDATLWVNWIRRMFDVKHPVDAKQASGEFGAYINDLIASRRQQRTDDFISMLMDSEVDGHRLTDKELHSFSTVVFGAGFETTADALGVMLWWLGAHPDDYRRLTQEPALIPPAVEEFLRYSSPIQLFGRNASHDLTLHGRAIPGGDVVALAFGSANHDPAAFPEPERCVLDRSPNRHVTFGAGPHLCLGAPVARLEMHVTLELFVQRIAAISVTAEADWKTRGDRRGVATLPATLHR
jgi:cytochrome P450